MQLDPGTADVSPAGECKASLSGVRSSATYLSHHLFKAVHNGFGRRPAGRVKRPDQWPRNDLATSGGCSIVNLQIVLFRDCL